MLRLTLREALPPHLPGAIHLAPSPQISTAFHLALTILVLSTRLLPLTSLEQSTPPPLPPFKKVTIGSFSLQKLLERIIIM